MNIGDILKNQRDRVVGRIALGEPVEEKKIEKSETKEENLEKSESEKERKEPPN